jgi:molecular chaperone HscB
MAAAGDDEHRRRVLAASAELNRAYDTLRSPVQRAEYLLALAGGPSSAGDKSVPGGLLGEVMMLREELDEAKSENDAPALEAMSGQVAARREAALAAIGELCRSLDSGGEAAQKALREQLNTIKYWDNLLEQLPADLQPGFR